MLPAVSEIAKAVHATAPAQLPTCKFHIRVYESETARDAVKAAEEKARQDREAAVR